MLILTRKIGESLVIGENIVVTILGVKGTQVRIGIKASKDIVVHREEVYKKLKENKDEDK